MKKSDRKWLGLIGIVIFIIACVRLGYVIYEYQNEEKPDVSKINENNDQLIEQKTIKEVAYWDEAVLEELTEETTRTVKSSEIKYIKTGNSPFLLFFDDIRDASENLNLITNNTKHQLIIYSIGSAESIRPYAQMINPTESLEIPKGTTFRMYFGDSLHIINTRMSLAGEFKVIANKRFAVQPEYARDIIYLNNSIDGNVILTQTGNEIFAQGGLVVSDNDCISKCNLTAMSKI